VAIKSNKGGVNKFYYGTEIKASKNDDNAGRNFIKDYEGWKQDVYYDSKKNATIGWGHLVKKDEFSYFTSGCFVTKQDGEDIFNKDYANNSVVGLKSIIKANPSLGLKTNEEDALKDIMFNGGPGLGKGFKLTDDGNYFFRYMKDKNLYYRRYAESLLYSEGWYLKLNEIGGKKKISKLDKLFNTNTTTTVVTPEAPKPDSHEPEKKTN